MGVFGFRPRRREPGPPFTQEPPLSRSSASLHHPVSRLWCQAGLTTQVYREHMSALTLESAASAQAAHFTKRPLLATACSEREQ